MRLRTLVALVALVAGLGSFIWFFERDLPSTDERAEQSRKLIRLDIESVRAVSLVAGDRSTRLERTSSADAAKAEWRLTQPLSGRADADQVQSVLERIGGLEKKRSLDDTARDQLGLETPRAEVRIESASGEVILRFGSEIPASSNTIVEIGTGPPFHVVSNLLFDDIVRDAEDWRSREAVPVERSQITRIEIPDPSGVALERGESGFRLVEPVQDVADEDRVASLLTSLVELEIDDFLDASDIELDSGALSAKLVLAESPEQILVEIEDSPAEDLATVRVDGQLFRAETDLASLLRLQPADWRSTKWSEREVFEIDGFRIVRAFGETAFHRREGAWLSDGVEIEYSKASAFLRSVSGARGAPVDSPPGHAPGEPALALDLESSRGTESLRLWADEAGYLGEREGRAALLRIAPEAAKELFANLEALEVAAESAREEDGPDSS